MNMKRRRFSLAVLAGAVAGSGAAHAQSDKPLLLVVRYAAGGSADLVARAVGAELSRLLGRQVLIENVSGASGMLAAQKVVSAMATDSVCFRIMRCVPRPVVMSIGQFVSCSAWTARVEPAAERGECPTNLR